MSILQDRRHLAGVLEKELGFYRTLFVLMDGQRDRLRSDTDCRLAGDFAAVREIHGRIEESEDLVTQARLEQEAAFDDWARTPEVSSLLEKISELAGRCHEAAADCGRLVQDKLASYRRELEQMGQGKRLLASMSLTNGRPRFIDQRP